MKIKFIENNQLFGIEYDWKLIIKEYKKLNIPKEVYTPTHKHFNRNAWFVDVSQRGTGKTTNYLLLGMIMNKLYGTILHYVRDLHNMITPKNMQDILSTIIRYNYIEKITDGKWHSAYYRSRRWYYCNRDNDGVIIEKSDIHFMYCCACDESATLKSSYQCDTADIIIFDEFISKYNYNGEFVDFVDLLSTLIRKRKSAKIFMLANTIDIENNMFYELTIADTIQSMEIGECVEVTTEKGTNIEIEIIGDKIQPQTKEHNKLFFGFNNPKLASITGEGWATFNYPHIWSEENIEYIYNGVYILHNGKYIRMDIVNTEKIGLCIFAHKATRTYEDSIIYTTEEITDKRFLEFSTDNKPITIFIKDMVRNRRVFYDNNTTGNLFSAFLKSIK